MIDNDEMITPEDLPETIRAATVPRDDKNDARPGTEPTDLKEYLRNCEAEFIVAALRESNWNQSDAAKLLQVPRRTLVHKIKALGIKRLGYSADEPQPRDADAD